MKVKRNKRPSHGDKRVIVGFAWLPKGTVKDKEIYWLQKYAILQQYTRSQTPGVSGSWVNMQFMNHKRYNKK